MFNPLSASSRIFLILDDGFGDPVRAKLTMQNPVVVAVITTPCSLLSNPSSTGPEFLEFPPDDDIGEPRETENARGP